MEKKLKGISLILFAMLFYLISGDIQAYFWDWGIGVSVPWCAIALFIGIVGVVFTFGKESDK